MYSMTDSLHPSKLLTAERAENFAEFAAKIVFLTFHGDLGDTPASFPVKIFSLFVIVPAFTVPAFKARSDSSLEGEY